MLHHLKKELDTNSKICIFVSARKHSRYYPCSNNHRYMNLAMTNSIQYTPDRNGIIILKANETLTKWAWVIAGSIGLVLALPLAIVVVYPFSLLVLSGMIKKLSRMESEVQEEISHWKDSEIKMFHVEILKALNEISTARNEAKYTRRLRFFRPMHNRIDEIETIFSNVERIVRFKLNPQHNPVDLSYRQLKNVKESLGDSYTEMSEDSDLYSQLLTK